MASGTRYLALIRGINVGGKNLIKMAELREGVEALGFRDVSTYIASGNVIFRAPRSRANELARQLEAGLANRFGLTLKMLVLTESQVRAVVEEAPEGFGAEDHSCDVIFLFEPLTPKRALAVIEIKEGVDQAWAGSRVVYHSRLTARASSSRISKVVAEPEYQDMTLRSWRTAQKLAGLLDN